MRRRGINANKHAKQKPNGGTAKRTIPATVVLSLVLAFLFIAAAASINLYQASLTHKFELKTASQPASSHIGQSESSAIHSDTIQHSSTVETLNKTSNKKTNSGSTQASNNAPETPPCDLLNLALAKQDYYTKKQVEENRHSSALQILSSRRWLGRLMQPGWYNSKLSLENQKHQSILEGIYTDFVQVATNLNCPAARPE